MGKTVIVVDDSRLVRHQVGLALTEAGYNVVEAVDGADGLRKIAAQPGAALVISDVNMPNMDGLEMLEELKKGGRHGSLPVMMLTTEGQTALIERAKRAGARGWIVKPFQVDLLVATVHKLTGGA